MSDSKLRNHDHRWPLEKWIHAAVAVAVDVDVVVVADVAAIVAQDLTRPEMNSCL